MPLTLRPEAPGDADDIHDLTRRAFASQPHSDSSEPGIASATARRRNRS